MIGRRRIALKPSPLPLTASRRVVCIVRARLGWAQPTGHTSGHSLRVLSSTRSKCGGETMEGDGFFDRRLKARNALTTSSISSAQARRPASNLASGAPFGRVTHDESRGQLAARFTRGRVRRVRGCDRRPGRWILRLVPAENVARPTGTSSRRATVSAGTCAARCGRRAAPLPPR